MTTGPGGQWRISTTGGIYPVWSGTTNSAYDLHPDGKRIAAAAVVDQGTIVRDRVVFVFNFAAYLAKIAPGKQ